MTQQSMYPGTGALINRISNSLEAAEQSEQAAIPESLFVKMFLPFFSGENVVEADELPAKWIAIAGNPFKSVQVFHDDTRDILYTVPPFFDEGAFTISDRKTGNISDMVKKVADLSLIHPAQGQNYFNRFINSLEILHDRKDEALRQTKVWLDIFKRYNVVPKDFQMPDGAVVPETTEGKVSSAAQLNFDDAEML